MNLVRFAGRHLITHRFCSHCNLRQALAFHPRPPSPTFVLDETPDTIDLDPELAKIAEAVRQQVKHAHIVPERAGGPETVNIKVRWRPHPRNTSAEKQCWTFKVRRVRLPPSLRGLLMDPCNIGSA